MASPDTDALTCSLCGAVPDAGDTDSQVPVAEVTKLNVPAPLFVTASEAGAGAAAPCVYVNDNELGETDKIG